MPRSLRSAVLFSLTSALLIGLASPGCSQQGEGERCDNLRNGNNDCDSGLVCKQANTLLENVTDRCCRQDNSYDDGRCTPNTGVVSGSGGTGGSGGTPAMSGGDGPVVGGAPDLGGAPGEMPVEQAGQPGTAGMPEMPSEAGAPSGGMSSTPAGGQGGAG